MKKRNFWRNYLITLLCLVLLVFAVVLFVVKRIDKNLTESTVSDVSPKAAFDEYVSGATVEDWAVIWADSNPDICEEEENIISFLSGQLTGKTVEYKKGLEYTMEKPVYCVYTDDELFCKVYLCSDDGQVYKVDYTEFAKTGDYSYTFYAPAESVVFCNGRQLSEGSITAKGVDRFPFNEPVPNRNSAVMFNEWTLSGYFEEPELYAEDQSGERLTLISDDYCVPISDDEFEKAVSDFLSLFTRFQMEGKKAATENLQQLRTYTIDDSPAYKYLGELCAYVYQIEATEDYVNDSKVCNAVVWSDSYFSSDVTINITDGNGDLIFDEAYKLLLEKAGDTYKVYDMIIIEDEGVN